MKIGITVDIRHSMFSAGHPNSCIAICEAFQVGGHDVVFITKELDKVWWEDVHSIKSDYDVEHVNTCSDLDLLIEVAFHLSTEDRARISKKSVWYCRKPALFTDMESTVFACRIEGRNLVGIKEIWLADIFNKSDDLEYLKGLYPNISVEFVPWIWTSTVVEAHRKEKQSPVWPQVNEIVPKETPWSLHIMETNASNTSSCIIPLLSLKNIGIKNIQVHNTEVISTSKFFKENIIKNSNLEFKMLGRQRVIDWSHEPKSIIVSHSRFVDLKMANLEAVWVGIPLIHNNPILRELGLDSLYYEGNSILDASNILRKTLETYSIELDTLTNIRERILRRFSPEARAKEWLSLLEEKKVLEKKKVYKVLFTDMWSDFNPEYNMFTLSLQEYMKDYIVQGTSNPKERCDVHIFGPFGSEWQRTATGVPKVHYTGENTGPIEHPSVKLNIGFKNLLRPDYLRVPLWMFELDLFEADLNKIRNPLPLPVYTCTHVNLQTRPKFCAFIVSNPKNSIRNEGFHTLNTYKPVDSAGRLYNNVGGEIFAGLGGGGGEIKKHEFLKHYKFCLCYENEQGDGYVTEKLFHAKAAGCIPIYWGSSDVVKDFDPRGFIYITDPSELVERVKEIDNDDNKWFQMASIPALTENKVLEVRDTFRIMSERIVQHNGPLVVTCATLPFMPSLVRWLNNIEQHVKVIRGLRAVVYLGKDVPDLKIEPLKKPFVEFRRFPTEVPEGFSDFWEPQHYAWKLWLLKNISEDPYYKGSLVLYTDCGSVIIRWPYEWLNMVKTSGLSFLDDPTQTNDRWCHPDFCKTLELTEDELHSNHIAACVIPFLAGNQSVIEFFTEAYRLGSIRSIIVGEKWSGKRPDGQHFGHRHDQSILSILSQRQNIHRISLNKIYNDLSARSTYYGGQCIYVHRGNYKTHIPLVEGIDEAYVINLDRRQDRLKSFVEHHPYFKGKVRRHRAVDGKTLSLTPSLCSLLRPNDFFWKKAVTGCALSHLKLWTMLQADSEEIQNYLIMEDDARLDPGWSEAWNSVYDTLPHGWQCVYLGGVLPPNKEGFKEVLEPVSKGLSRIAPNTLFGTSVPMRHFHFCTYAYVLSRRGVQAVLAAIQSKGGIWTSTDHILFNSMDKERVYILDPLVAGASQDNDPAYLNSDFNDFSRIDNFDSDLWNNDERFSSDEISLMPKEPIDLLRTVNEIYIGVSIKKFVSLKNIDLYEKEWLEELLGHSIEISVVSKETELPYNDLTVIVQRNNWKEQTEWIQKIKKEFKIIHLSDEFEQDPLVFYERAKSVLRMYSRNDIPENKQVLTIPLGYHWIDKERKVPLEKRQYVWSFCGTDWKNRSEELKPLLQIQPYKAQFYPDWNHSSQLSRDDYTSLLLNTQFVPCPKGNNVETFRFYEALEHGCIPVFTELPPILRNSGIPFIKTETWSDVLSLIKELSENSIKRNTYQLSIEKGWISYKSCLKQRIKELGFT